MPILEPEKSLANNTSGAQDLHYYRRFYKNNILVTYPGAPQYSRLQPGVEEFWYDRNLYGKIDLDGDLVLLRESALDTLTSNSGKTFYALNFVATMFNEMIVYMKNNMDVNNVPNKETIYKNLGAATSWGGIYGDYHDYILSLYGLFFSTVTKDGNLVGIENFDDFAKKFFNFIKTQVAGRGYPFTLSGYVASNSVTSLNSGLVIDLFKFNGADDVIKTDIFINDVNYDFYRHSASKHGFVIDKNIPWRLAANLKSDTMKAVMALPKFDVTYENGSKNLFKRYYTKVYTLDMEMIRQYLYMMYNALAQSNPTYQKKIYCGPSSRLKIKEFKIKQLSNQEKAAHIAENYWLEMFYRYRLMELKHDRTEEKIRGDLKKAKNILKYKGERKAIEFLYRKIKKYFLNQYNEIETIISSTPSQTNIVISPAISH